VVFLSQHNPRRRADLRTAIIQQRWFPVEEMMTMDGRDVVSGATERALGWYAQVWALGHFLRYHQRYRAGFARMLSDAAAGRFHMALNLPPDDLAQLQRRRRIYNRTVARRLFAYYITPDQQTFERQYAAFCRKLARLPQRDPERKRQDRNAARRSRTRPMTTSGHDAPASTATRSGRRRGNQS